MAVGEIEGGHLRSDVLLAGAVLVFQIDIGPAVHHPQVAAAELGPQLLVAVVEDQHIGVADLLHHQLAHILYIHLEASGVHQTHDLVEDPVGRQAISVQRLDHPHTVILDDDLLGPVLLLQLLEQLRSQLTLLVHRVGKHIAQHTGVVLQLPLLAADQQGTILLGKAVPEDTVDEAGFAGIQKTGDEIDRNIHSSSLLTGVTG